MASLAEAVQIPVHRGGRRFSSGEVAGYVQVDPIDGQLGDYRWAISSDGYAVRTVHHGDGRRETVLMHRVILGLTKGDPRTGDHLNRNRLDNRRVNLRIVPKAAQPQNRGSHAGSASAFRGVARSGNRWVAYATVNYRRTNIGSFATEMEAAQAAADFRMQNMPWAVG